MKSVSAWMILMTGAAILGSGAGCSGQRSSPSTDIPSPCPDSPNCVSSSSSDPRHKVAPIAYTGSPAEARRHLLEVIRSLSGTRVVADDGSYLRVEFTSAVFRFVDDVEFYIDPAQKLIQVRSASRVGYWDLGANRRRVEDIRRRMTADTKQGP